MRKLRRIALSLTCALAVSSCETLPLSGKPVEVPPPQLAPAPPDVMAPRQANFLERLKAFFQSAPASSSSDLPPKPTK